MIYRNMEKLGVAPSLLGFGCMRLPRKNDSTIDEVMAQAMIDEAIKSGITYFDTAYTYHEGKSEAFLGKALAKHDRSSYMLATKLPTWAVQNVDDAKKYFERQMSRLNVDYIDFYLLHSLEKERWERMRDNGILEYCEQLQAQGKIKYFGFSFHDTYEIFEDIINYRNWDFAQIQLNYMDVDHQAGIKGYKLCHEKDIPVIVMEPVKGGSLAELPPDIMETLRAVIPERKAADWALRWVANFPGIQVILSGMSVPEQLEENMKSLETFEPMTEAELTAIEKVRKEFHERVQNDCTQCNYCMPCPAGVNIPTNFRLWNEYHTFQNENAMRWQWHAMLEESDKSYKCTQCGKCEEECPQHIPIREDLKQVTEDFAHIRPL